MDAKFSLKLARFQNMQLYFQDLYSHLKNSKLDSHFFIMGNDGGQITDATSEILRKYFAGKEHNVEEICCKELEKRPFLLEKSLTSLQLFSQTKAIILHSISAIPRKIWQMIIDLNINKTLVVAQAENIQRHSRVYHLFSSLPNFRVVNCRKFNRLGTRKFIQTYLENNDIECEKNAVDSILHLMPDDYVIIKNELKKLSQYSPKGKILSIEGIKSVVSDFSNLEYIDLLFAMVTKKVCFSLEKINALDYDETTRILQYYLDKILVMQEKIRGKEHSIVSNHKPCMPYEETSAFAKVLSSITRHDTISFIYELMELQLTCRNRTTREKRLTLSHYLIQKIQS